MANDFLNRVNKTLKQKVRDKKQADQDEVRMGLLSFMLEDVTTKIVNGFSRALGSLKLPTPQVTVQPPEVTVNTPEVKVPKAEVDVKMPEIKVPTPQVTVNVPDVNVPPITIPEIKIPDIKVPRPSVTVNTPKIEMPDEMQVAGAVAVTNDRGNPVPMTPVDLEGNPMNFGGGDVSAGPRQVKLAGTNGKAVEVTKDGGLHVVEQESGLGIAMGNNSHYSFIHKFGGTPDFDVSDGFVSVWDGADDGGINQMKYVYSEGTANINTFSSNNAVDTQSIEVQGLDSNYDLQTETIVLNGTSTVASVTNFQRVFRMKNVDTTDNAGSIYCFTHDTAVVAGVPATSANVRAIMQPGNNQTLMAIYTIPNGYTGYMRDWYASTAGAKRDSQHTIQVRARPQGQVFQLKHESNISVNGTSYIQHEYTEPEKFSEKTDIEVRADTDTDIAGVSGGFDIVLVANE